MAQTTSNRSRKVSVEFDQFTEARYEFANGHRPRGAGGWMFDVVYSGGGKQSTKSTITPSFGLYSAAKKTAIEQARVSCFALGYDRAVITVCT